MTEGVAPAQIDCGNVGCRHAPEAIAIGTRRPRWHTESVGDSLIAPREQSVTKTVSSAMPAAGSQEGPPRGETAAHAGSSYDIPHMSQHRTHRRTQLDKLGPLVRAQ